MGLTSTPKDKYKSTKLRVNPEPDNQEESHLQFQVHTGKKSYYGEPLENWKFDKEDFPVVRHRIKKYKKSANRRPPWWYENKRKKK